ncbi:DUF4214 domain-containing protein [uncultured Marivita sp.]|uniref:DUF4214 domain-containing protein n=1 Tax=uncultured Marivita sp. TaxID=888080 RepID=UPI00262F935C|nr:DUF4214 domain-containing protein [uncultured Marivita sp.]
MENEFEQELAASLASLAPIASFGGLTAPTTIEGLFQLTVGEYLDLLNVAEQALQANRPTIQGLLNNPQVTANLDAEALAFLQDWADGDFSLITEAFDVARAALSGVPRSTLLIEVEGLDGDGGTIEDELQQAFADAEARLIDLLWEENSGLFTSPTFTIDPATGDWFIPGANSFSGTTLAELWALVGEAAGNAVVAFFQTQTNLINQIADNGASAADFEQAEAAVQVAAASALEALQSYGTALTTTNDVELSSFEALALAQYSSVISAITDILPGLADALDALIIGSRNSNPTFVVSLEGEVDGSDEGDWFYLNDLANTFDGGIGTDVAFGFGGDDQFTGGVGDDTFFGGMGTDTAVYSGNQASYTLQFSPNGTTVTDRRPSADGMDTLIDTENLQFSDGNFYIGIRAGAVELTAEDFSAIVELYIAYFNRAPASKGLLYWADRLADDMTLPEIAESFFNQVEIQTTYSAYLDAEGNLADTQAFVNAVFNNVLGRDPSGPYWVNQLETNPEMTPAIFILAVLNGAKAATGSASDAEYLADKTDIGVYFSAIKGLSNYDDTIAVMSLYDGSATSIQAAINETDQIHTAALDPNNGEFLIELVGVIDDPFSMT